MDADDDDDYYHYDPPRLSAPPPSLWLVLFALAVLAGAVLLGGCAPTLGAGVGPRSAGVFPLRVYRGASAGTCTAWAASPRLVVTAAHCVLAREGFSAATSAFVQTPAGTVRVVGVVGSGGFDVVGLVLESDLPPPYLDPYAGGEFRGPVVAHTWRSTKEGSVRGSQDEGQELVMCFEGPSKVQRGDSGSPVTSAGEVVGVVVSFVDSPSDCTAYAVDVAAWRHVVTLGVGGALAGSQ